MGRAGVGFRDVHGGFGYGPEAPDAEGESILEFALANGLVVGNTCFKKSDNHLITYRSGGATTQVDYILYRKSMRKQVLNVKVIPFEECATQHELLLCDFKVTKPPKIKRKFQPKLKTWKLKDLLVQKEFQEKFATRIQAGETPDSTEDLWTLL